MRYKLGRLKMLKILVSLGLLSALSISNAQAKVSDCENFKMVVRLVAYVPGNTVKDNINSYQILIQDVLKKSDDFEYVQNHISGASYRLKSQAKYVPESFVSCIQQNLKEIQISASLKDAQKIETLLTDAHQYLEQMKNFL